MEYVHGHNLRDLLATRGALSVRLAGEIAVQALDALAYLHDQKFVHRDISPDNLMLTTTAGKPFVKLIDLGISKSLDAGQTMTGTGQFIGKVSYASPEQFSGDVDGRSDLYSLGVVLFKLLTNADPFTGNNYKELIAAHLFQPPRRFEDVAPDREIPEAVQRVVYRALEKEPERRFQSAGEFCAAAREAFGIHDKPTLSYARTEAEVTGAAPPVAGTTIVDSTIADHTAVDRTVVDRTVVDGSRPNLKWPIAAAVVLALLAAGILLWRSYETAHLARYGKFYAVVIGESRYRKFEELPTAVADARAVADLLESKYGFEVTRLENAGSRKILDALQASGKKMTGADNLLVFYAGHGTLKNDKGYWQPVDADFDMTNWISPAVIKDVLLDHPARRTLVIADSCYSGALARGALSTATDREGKRSRLVISSGGNAPVVDSADGQHSIFTRALLDVLGDPGRGAIEVESIFGRIRERVVDSARRAGREQNPELAVLAEVGDEGGSFFFVPRAK
jgi:hypothetical protein